MDGNPGSSRSLSELLCYAREAGLDELCSSRALDPTAWEELRSRVARRIHLRPGDALFQQRQPLRGVYVVSHGLLKTVLVNGGETEQIAGFCFPGEWQGLDALHKRSHVCSAFAVEASAVDSVPPHLLRQAMSEAPSLRDGIEGLVASSLAGHKQWLAVVNQRPALERVAVLVFILSCRLGSNGLAALEFRLAFSRADLANYLGLAPETATRAIVRLRALGILSGYGKHVRIDDMRALLELVLWGR